MGYMVQLGYLVGPVVPRDRVCVGIRGFEELDHLDHVDHAFDTTDPAQRPPARDGGVLREPEMIPSTRRTRAAVLARLQGSREPMSRNGLQTATRLTQYAVRVAVSALLEAGQIEEAGFRGRGATKSVLYKPAGPGHVVGAGSTTLNDVEKGA
ncbi:MAG: hypothetical protein FJX75_25925 [Armatimonadetes bacterium]|nr:hypothetical protein [Armatimonadota bacterium]